MPVPTVCPLCKHRMGELRPRCQRCGGDLGALVHVADAANRRFNEGVRWGRLGRWRLAAEAFSAALAIDPGDEEAEQLLDRVRNARDRSTPSEAG